MSVYLRILNIGFFVKLYFCGVFFSVLFVGLILSFSTEDLLFQLENKAITS